jgi:aspartyl-tRNA(Asn)/glutamyl-tRNA(Gln) amidotransferase subunit B
MPDARAERFAKDYGIPAYDASVLTGEKPLADFFEASTRLFGDAKTVANWMMGDLLGVIHDKDLEIKEAKITPETFGGMLQLIKNGRISGKIGKIILPELVVSGKTAEEIVEERDMGRISDKGLLDRVVDEVFEENATAVEDALGDDNAANYLIGHVMRKTKGKADPQMVNEAVRERLKMRRERR